MTTIITNTIFEQLFNATNFIVEAYRTDFDHDRRMIEESPTTPFVHTAYSTGTYLDQLPPLSDYPAPGVKVPFLFGHADRWHLLKSTGCGVRAILTGPRNHICHYFDGKVLRQITIKEADLVIKEYQQKMTDLFRD